jgi:hypothetical protein
MCVYKKVLDLKIICFGIIFSFLKSPLSLLRKHTESPTSILSQNCIPTPYLPQIYTLSSRIVTLDREVSKYISHTQTISTVRMAQQEWGSLYYYWIRRKEEERESSQNTHPPAIKGKEEKQFMHLGRTSGHTGIR